MSDKAFAFDVCLHNQSKGRIRLSVASIPTPSLKVEVMYVYEGGDDDADICRLTTDNLDTLTRLRDALNQILGD